MAGSIKWFIYTADSTLNWAYRADESNTKAVLVAGGQDANTNDYASDTTVVHAIPRNLKPRTAMFRSADGKVSRRIVVPTPTAFAGLTGGDSISDDVSAQTLYFVSKRGEELRVPFAPDTGLDDGTAT